MDLTVDFSLPTYISADRRLKDFTVDLNNASKELRISLLAISNDSNCFYRILSVQYPVYTTTVSPQNAKLRWPIYVSLGPKLI